MSLVINHNLMAMNAARNLSTSYSNLSTSDTGQQGEYYIDYISQPLIPSLLRSKILSSLHIHHLKQELLSNGFNAARSRDTLLTLEQSWNWHKDLTTHLLIGHRFFDSTWH